VLSWRRARRRMASGAAEVSAVLSVEHPAGELRRAFALRAGGPPAFGAGGQALSWRVDADWRLRGWARWSAETVATGETAASSTMLRRCRRPVRMRT
jgi:hypothetical protein